jgi:hypothetical protein
LKERRTPRIFLCGEADKSRASSVIEGASL